MTAAIRYANALFALAQDAKSQPAVATAAASLAAALDDATVAAALANPRLTTAQREKLAASMAKSVKSPLALANTLGILATNNRLSVLPEVLAAYQALADEAAGIAAVKVSTAAPLTEAQRTKLISAIKAHTKATDVRLDETVDASLMGGFRAFFGGKVWDASLAGSLARLSTRLKASVAQAHEVK